MGKFKKLAINVAIKEFDKIYIHALPHPKLIVGERGLINSEKNNGIVLVIGSSSCLELKIDNDFIFAKLRFNGIWEDVFIPYEAVNSVLNDLHSPLFIFNFPYYEDVHKEIPHINKYLSTPSKKTKKTQAEIVRPDFTKM